MKNIVIVGTGSFARLMHQYLLECDEREVVAFSVNRTYIGDEREFCGKPVIALEELRDHYPPEEYEVLMGVGYTKMNMVRKSLFEYCKEQGYTVASFVHPTVYLSKSAVLGEGNIILERSSLAPFTKIGDGNLIWDNVQLAHEDELGNYNTCSGGAAVAGNTKIGDNCYLGKCSVVFDNISVADFTLVGAGAFAKKDTKPYDVIVPARSVTLENRRSTDFL